MTSTLIADLCLSKFESLPSSGKPKSDEWTILSCFVQEIKKDFQVVSLGTGTKCLGVSHHSPNVVVDSHGEVIAKRSFQRYLLHQMELSLSSASCIFDSDLKIKKDVKFHFFSSHTPCGDGSIFPKRCKTDIHRTGAKSTQDKYGTGVHYHVLGVSRTKPGRGEPTNSLSCSDKMYKWNTLGLQGKILKPFIGKITWDSIIILGDSNASEALNRALLSRETSPSVSIVLLDKNFEFGKGNKRSRPCADSIFWSKVPNTPLGVSNGGRKAGVIKKHWERAKIPICRSSFAETFIQTAFQIPILKEAFNWNSVLTYSFLKGFFESTNQIENNNNTDPNHFIVYSPKIYLLKSESTGTDLYQRAFEKFGYSVDLISSLDFEFTHQRELELELNKGKDFDGIIFTSPRAVEAVSRLTSSLESWRVVYSVGPGTHDALLKNCNVESLGWNETGNALSLAKYILSHNTPQNSFFFPCGNLRSDDLTSILPNVKSLEVYKTIQHKDLEENIEKKMFTSAQSRRSFLVFFSPSSVKFSYPYLVNRVSENFKFVALGPSTRKALEKIGVTVFAMAEFPTPEALLKCFVK